MTLSDNLLFLEKAGLISLAAVRPEPEFTFRHALVQQAAYNTYLKSQRRMVHQVIAEVVEQAQAGTALPEAQATDLAYHYFEAGNWAKAMAYARLAAERAQARYASHEAVLHFSLALEAAAQLNAPPPLELLRSRGQAYEVLGDFERAQADFAAALEQARAAGEWQIEWQVLLDLGLLWASRDYKRTGEYYRQALQLAQAMGDEAVLAHSLNRLGNWHFNAGENMAALDYHQEALGIFKRLEARRGLAETYDLLGMVQTVSGQMRQGHTSYEHAVALFREQDDRVGLVSSLATLAEQGPSLHTDTAAHRAPIAEAREHGRLAVQIARQIGFRAGEAYALCSLANLVLQQGDYAEALPDIRAAMRIADEIGHRQWQAFSVSLYGMACLALFRFEEAYQHLEPAYAIALEINSAIWIAGTKAMLVLSYLEQGEPDKAEALLRQHPTRKDALSLHERLLAIARAQLALVQGQAAQALEITQDLIENTPEYQPGVVIPRLWHVRGLALAAQGQTAEGIADLQAACTASLRQGTRPQVWRIQLELARLYEEQGRPAEAEAERAAAQALVESLAANVPDPTWREHFRQQALAKFQGIH